MKQARGDGSERIEDVTASKDKWFTLNRVGENAAMAAVNTTFRFS